MQPPQLPRIRLVLFDIFDTLLRPLPPPSQQYAIVARHHGLRVTDAHIHDSFRAAFRAQSARHPLYGLHTGLPDPDAWWRLVIRQTFAAAAAAAADADADARGEEKLELVCESLIGRFGSAEAYGLFGDVEATLRELKGRGVEMGVVSNSDDKVVRAMSELGIGRFMNLEGGRGGPTLSYEEGVEKPGREIFRAGLRRFGFGSEEASEVLYVGDQLGEDFWGAKDAGLQALWLRREGVGMRNQARRNDEAERSSAEDRETVTRGTISGLEEILERLVN